MSVKRSVKWPVKRSLARALTSPSAGGGSFIERLSATNKPMPAFVEGWAASSFHGQINTIPAGYAALSADSEGEKIYTVNVTGAAGATTLSGTFDTSQTGSWSCSILHDDGTYGIYTASGISASAINIQPPLRATTTAKPLASLGGSLNGQHYGLQGYKALARKIFATTNREGYRLRYAKAWRAQNDAKEEWGRIVIGPTAYSVVTANAFPNTSGSSYWLGRGNKQLSFGPFSVAGYGVTYSADLGGQSGYLETFVSAGAAAGAVRVEVLIDSVSVYDQTFTEFRRVVVPYAAATTGLLRITIAASVSTNPRIGDTTWWTYDRAATWTDRVIGADDNVVVLGDSWSARYSGGLGLEIAQAQTDAGGTTGSVTTVALASQTAEWGLSVFDAQVAPLNPDVVVIEFFVNDKTSFGLANSDRWLDALYQIGLKCQAIGARPVFVMPLPTQSISQSGELGQWAERIGVGLPST